MCKPYLVSKYCLNFFHEKAAYDHPNPIFQRLRSFLNQRTRWNTNLVYWAMEPQAAYDLMDQNLPSVEEFLESCHRQNPIGIKLSP